MSGLELNDIQANIVRGYRASCGVHLFLRFDGPEGGRRFVDSLREIVTTSRHWKAAEGGAPMSRRVAPPTLTNVGFTFDGLEALGLSCRALASFPSEFRDGMKARAALLKDEGESDPGRWEEPWKTTGVHACVSVYAARALGEDALEALQAARRRVEEAGAAAQGVEFVAEQPVALLWVPGRGLMTTEHFVGYADGLANPDVAGSGLHPKPGGGKLVEGGGWAPLAAGEFLLGHPDETGELSPTPWPFLMGRNGTYMVYRKLNQKVKSFREHLDAWGERYPGGKELLTAKLLGRQPDGTPLATSPDRPDPGSSRHGHTHNDFRYGDDPIGLKCPLSAHIRRVNPRDADGFGGAIANRHRMIRRGMTYGDFIPPGEPADDDGEHGLVFIAFVASLRRQFEFVQRQWVNYGDVFREGNDSDLLASGMTTKKMVIPGTASGPGRGPFLCTGLGPDELEGEEIKEIPAFVTLRGGDYFFMPSLTGLRLIAQGVEQED